MQSQSVKGGMWGTWGENNPQKIELETAAFFAGGALIAESTNYCWHTFRSDKSSFSFIHSFTHLFAFAEMPLILVMLLSFGCLFLAAVIGLLCMYLCEYRQKNEWMDGWSNFVLRKKIFLLHFPPFFLLTRLSTYVVFPFHVPRRWPPPSPIHLSPAGNCDLHFLLHLNLQRRARIRVAPAAPHTLYAHTQFK